jgi:hypothetical protein
MKFLHTNYTPLFIFDKKKMMPILFKTILASLIVVFTTSNTPSKEMTSCS